MLLYASLAKRLKPRAGPERALSIMLNIGQKSMHLLHMESFCDAAYIVYKPDSFTCDMSRSSTLHLAPVTGLPDNGLKRHFHSCLTQRAAWLHWQKGHLRTHSRTAINKRQQRDVNASRVPKSGVKCYFTGMTNVLTRICCLLVLLFYWTTEIFWDSILQWLHWVTQSKVGINSF